MGYQNTQYFMLIPNSLIWAQKIVHKKVIVKKHRKKCKQNHKNKKTHSFLPVTLSVTF
jgi:hypothetical protein